MSDSVDTAASATRVSHSASGNGRGNCEMVSQLDSVADLLAKFALTDAEVGRLVGVPASTVANLHRTGALRAVKVGGRLVWRPRDVAAYIEQLQPGE